MPRKPYKFRINQHKDRIIFLYTPEGPDSELIISGSADG